MSTRTALVTGVGYQDARNRPQSSGRVGGIVLSELLCEDRLESAQRAPGSSNVYWR